MQPQLGIGGLILLVVGPKHPKRVVMSICRHILYQMVTRGFDWYQRRFYKLHIGFLICQRGVLIVTNCVLMGIKCVLLSIQRLLKVIVTKTATYHFKLF